MCTHHINVTIVIAMYAHCGHIICTNEAVFVPTCTLVCNATCVDELKMHQPLPPFKPKAWKESAILVLLS